MKIWPNMIQQSEEWFRARKGRVTASNADRILTPTGKDSSQWDDFVIDLCAESIAFDEPEKFAGNYDTDRGNELEPEAMAEFSRIMGLEVIKVGFVSISKYNHLVGLSPDALILKPGVVFERDAIYDSDGAIINGKDLIWAGLEGKAPKSKKHAKNILADDLPKDHFPQVHYSMAVTGLPWYFISYCPAFHRGKSAHIGKPEPSPYTAKMADAIDRFVIYYGARRAEIMPLLLGKEAA